jgi:hypothetical protein
LSIFRFSCRNISREKERKELKTGDSTIREGGRPYGGPIIPGKGVGDERHE